MYIAEPEIQRITLQCAWYLCILDTLQVTAYNILLSSQHLICMHLLL